MNCSYGEVTFPIIEDVPDLDQYKTEYVLNFFFLERTLRLISARGPLPGR